MHGARLPAQAHLRTRRERHFACRAHEKRSLADARRNDRIGAVVFGAGDGGGDAVVGDADVLGPDAESAPGAFARPHRLQRHEVHGRRADEARGEGARRPRIELGGRARLLDPPRAQQDHVVGHAHRLDLIVRHVDDRHVEAPLQRADLGAHLLAQLRVEVGERLVHQADRVLGDDGARERDALALPAGEFLRLVVQPLSQAHQLRHLRQPAFSLLFG